MKKFVLVIFITLLTSICYAEPDDKIICQAIYIIEGGDKTSYPYGIQSVKCEGKAECEQVCLNTIKNNKIRFKKQTFQKDFYTFLAKRYCPPNWKVWRNNLIFYLKKFDKSLKIQELKISTNLDK